MPPVGMLLPMKVFWFISRKNAKYAIGSRTIAKTDVGMARYGAASFQKNGPSAPTQTIRLPNFWVQPLGGLPRSSQKHRPLIVMSIVAALIAIPITPKPKRYWATTLPVNGASVSARLKASRLTSMAAILLSAHGKALILLATGACMAVGSVL